MHIIRAARTQLWTIRHKEGESRCFLSLDLRGTLTDAVCTLYGADCGQCFISCRLEFIFSNSIPTIFLYMSLPSISVDFTVPTPAACGRCKKVFPQDQLDFVHNNNTGAAGRNCCRPCVQYYTAKRTTVMRGEYFSRHVSASII